MRTDGLDHTGYNGLPCRGPSEEAGWLMVRGGMETRKAERSMLRLDAAIRLIYNPSTPSLALPAFPRSITLCALPTLFILTCHLRVLEVIHLLSANPQFRLPPLSTLLPTHENIYTLPNLLTFSRLIAAPIVGYLIINDLHIPALGLFAYASVTDLVDGWIARKWGLQTVVGTVIDPMADKALMTIVTVTLAMKGAIPCE